MKGVWVVVYERIYHEGSVWRIPNAYKNHFGVCKLSMWRSTLGAGFQSMRLGRFVDLEVLDRPSIPPSESRCVVRNDFVPGIYEFNDATVVLI